MKAILYIEGPYESRTVTVEDEVTIGRTELARVVLDDSGLSRVNTTVFVDDGEAYVADENSLNGTFLNGERIVGRPRKLADGDRIRIGSSTEIRVSIDDPEFSYAPGSTFTESQAPAQTFAAPEPAPSPAVMHAETEAGRDRTPMILIAAGVMTVLIVLFTGAGIYFAARGGDDGPRSGVTTPTPRPEAIIPVRVIDPLGGEDEDDLDDLIASWETAEEEIQAENVADIADADAEEAELNVTAAFLADRQRKALENRPGEKGIRPAGLIVPPELRGDGVIKQKAKLRQMNAMGYRQPLDFAELAEKRMSRELIEMPMAAESFYLDVGGSAQDRPFSSFSFKDGIADIVPGTPKYDILSRLANDFAGHRYDLNNPAHRKQMRMRLLRMFNQRAKPILQELAGEYYQKFGRPLRVTSLTRSMDYQILLNANNPNSFRVRGEGALPPHTSGCAFDLARKHMPVEEQNFVMQVLARMEREGRLDALIEYGTNACFHVFVYDDGIPPNM